MLISVYPGYLSPYGLHLSPKDLWYHLRKKTVNGFFKNGSVCYCLSFLFYIRSLQPAITGCDLLCLLLKFSFSRLVQESPGSESGSGGSSSQWLTAMTAMADTFHGPYPYVVITAPRQMVPICLRVPITEQERGCGGLQTPCDGT